MQIIVLEAKTVKGDPNSLILSFDLNGIRRPAKVKEAFNALRAMKGRTIELQRLLHLLASLADLAA